MRIVDNNNPGPAPADQTTRTTGTQATGAAAKGSSASASSEAPDGLQLSRFAGTLSQVMQSDSATRSQRVAQLAAAVKSGTYQVDSAAVSRSIVDHAISTGQNAQ
jgi:flagellar biosynthesis anti-sigma factor FlgM